MGLITYTNLEDGTSVTANKFNERFGDIVDTVNGNLDTQNLANNAVTTAKIADGAVTSAKIDTDKYVDANGWQVEDLGTSKTYTYTISVNGLVVAAGNRAQLTPILPPVGRTNDNILITPSWFGSYSGHTIPGVEKSGVTPDTGDDSNPTGTYIGPMLFNSFQNQALPLTGKVYLTAVEAL